MMVDIETHAQTNLKNQISKELRCKANDFLNSRRHANNIVDIIAMFEKSLQEQLPLNSTILTLEVIFVELFKRRELCMEVVPLKPREENTESRYREWLVERYEEAFQLILNAMDTEKGFEATQALVTSMKLLAVEGKNPLEKCDIYSFPKQRLRKILQKLLSQKRSNSFLIQRFKEYTGYLDVVYHSWKMLHTLANRTQFENEVFALNFLELLNALGVTKEIQEERKLFCSSVNTTDENFEYNYIRKCINKMWGSIMQWCDNLPDVVHKQILIVLLERILPHLEKPILLTDFLMDSLDCGGAISLLALQGIFTLIHKHNVTYPNIYTKLYSMFEPEIFHTKYKARLFYLADIFLSSTHLPENLVAAFVKRLSRLSLIAPPEDIIIILYFIGNLILRHPELKRLICAQTPVELSRDPYIMEEREPVKSNAIESSLWEIVLLKNHAIPSVATAARFIHQPLPTTEWDLSTVLEMKLDDMFDQEIAQNTKQYALAFERPQSMYLVKNDKFLPYWKLF